MFAPNRIRHAAGTRYRLSGPLEAAGESRPPVKAKFAREVLESCDGGTGEVVALPSRVTWKRHYPLSLRTAVFGPNSFANLVSGGEPKSNVGVDSRTVPTKLSSETM